MQKASKVMYTIANVFNWIVAVLLVATIVLISLVMAGVIPQDANTQGMNAGMLVPAIISLAFVILTIVLVRVAKKNGTSKGWDILFIVLGVVDLNIFYILGGIFGILGRD